MPSGPEGAPVPRLQFTPRSLVTAVALLGATLAVLALVAAAHRVLGWVLAAAALAGLLHPLVAGLGRFMRRGFAILVVVFGLLFAIGTVGYGLVQNLTNEIRVLQEAAPRQARRIERSDRFGQAARNAHLVQRTRGFVDRVPQRLQGGTPAEALRAAATRSVSFLVTGVLSLFLLVHGPRLAEAAIAQLPAGPRRDRVRRVALTAYQRAFGYAGGTLAMAVAAGLLGYIAARLVDVPGPVPLALWIALWDVVPVIGALIGALPIVALAAIVDFRTALGAAAVFVAYQVFEARVLQRRVERRTIRLGPFLTVVAAAGGLELYGLGGALVALLALTLVAAVVDELAARPAGSGGPPAGYGSDMEESNKHGTRIDEALKQHEDGNSRTEDFRRFEGPHEGDDLPGAAARPDLDDQVDLSGVDERSNLARFLLPHVFPAHPGQLVEAAVETYAPEPVLTELRLLPDRLYDNVQQVWEALGGTAEPRF